jgi:SHS2 domain-containing protein
MERDDNDLPFPGVRALDHTADVGLELSAPDLPELLRRAARGFSWLLLEREAAGSSESRPLLVRAEAPATLLRELLRELLWWYEGEGLATRDLVNLRIREGDCEIELAATARLVRDEGAPVREIKGVTLHGLVAEPRGSGWYGRVIFDV